MVKDIFQIFPFMSSEIRQYLNYVCCGSFKYTLSLLWSIFLYFFPFSIVVSHSTWWQQKRKKEKKNNKRMDVTLEYDQRIWIRLKKFAVSQLWMKYSLKAPWKLNLQGSKYSTCYLPNLSAIRCTLIRLCGIINMPISSISCGFICE